MFYNVFHEDKIPTSMTGVIKLQPIANSRMVNRVFNSICFHEYSSPYLKDDRHFLTYFGNLFTWFRTAKVVAFNDEMFY